MRGIRALVVVAGVLASVAMGASGANALSVQEAILRAKPGVALIKAEIGGEVTIDCGQGPVTVTPPPFIETGTGWFIDGRGYLITNAHVVDPSYRLPPWVTHELKKKAIDQACVEPALRRQGLMRGQQPELEEQIRQKFSGQALTGAKVVARPQITVLLSSGVNLEAKVLKFSAPPSLDRANKPLPDSGRDLALLQVASGDYPALVVSTREPQIGDGVHILGFPGVVLSHELLNESATLEASVTSGTVSGLKQDVIGQDVVQTDAPASHGNSGGPAIRDDANVLGVMDFVSLSASGAQIQGYNFLIPAKDVLKFLEGTDVKPGESTFSTEWAAGLSLLFNERYPAAAARIGEANRLRPNLPDVKRALAEAEYKIQHPPPRPFPWAWATLGVTLLSVGVYGGMWARRWWRNRFRVLPGQVIGFIERGLSPVLLDVRTKTDYETSPLKLPGAVRRAPEDIEAGRIDLDGDLKQLIVTYDTTPDEATSARVTARLRERGFKNVRILKGGLGGWTNARLPIEAKASLPSIGLELYKNLTLGDVERRRFRTGETIFEQDAEALGEAFVIHSGTVEIRKRIDGSEGVLARFGEGELLGEMALFRRAPRSAAAVAVTDVELLVIKYERLEWLIRNRPQLTQEILTRLSEWVADTDATRARVTVDTS